MILERLATKVSPTNNQLTIEMVRSGLAEIVGGGGSSSCSELVAHASVGVLLGLLLLTLQSYRVSATTILLFYS